MAGTKHTSFSPAPDGTWEYHPEGQEAEHYDETLRTLDAERAALDARVSQEVADLVARVQALEDGEAPPPPSIDPLVQSYADAVNVRRSELDPPAAALATDEVARLNQLWARIGDSQGEVGRDLRPSLLDAGLLRAAQGVGQGPSTLTLRRAEMTAPAAPAWGVSGATFTAADQALALPGPLVTAFPFTVLTVARRAFNGEYRYAVSQYDRDTDAKGEMFAAVSNANQLVNFFQDGTVDQNSMAGPAQGVLFGCSTKSDGATVSIYSPQTGARDTDPVDHTFQGHRFTVGGSSDRSAGRGWRGDIVAVLAFAAYLSAAEERAVWDIYRATAGLGLGLTAAL